MLPGDRDFICTRRRKKSRKCLTSASILSRSAFYRISSWERPVSWLAGMQRSNLWQRQRTIPGRTKRIMRSVFYREHTVTFCPYRHVLSFVFAGSEQNALFRCLMYFRRQRCLRMAATIDDVNRVEYGYCDTCCEGLEDPSQHWFCKIWPGARSWPKKDFLHGMIAITRATQRDTGVTWSVLYPMYKSGQRRRSKVQRSTPSKDAGRILYPLRKWMFP